MRKIRVNLGERGYDILVACHEIDKELGRVIKRLNIGKDVVIIVNPAINHLFRKRVERSLVRVGFNVKVVIVPDTERSKSQKYCIALLNKLSKFDNSQRRLFIIALGGGVIGDLAGFVASIYRRGVPYIQVPTTLLAQVDSSIGGKVAIDLNIGKNLIGSFYQPRLVFSDVSLLKTLHRKELISGLAEVIKYGIIESPELFRFLEENYQKILRRNEKTLQYIVYKCSLIKARVVEKDEFDNKNIRVMLNFGHTIGHAIEVAAHYSKIYSHGHAVALGMLSSSFISNQMGLLSEKDYSRIKALIKKVGLPFILKNLSINDILLGQEHDKKFIHGKNRFVLPLRIGRTIVKENIARSLVKDSIAVLYGAKKR